METDWLSSTWPAFHQDDNSEVCENEEDGEGGVGEEKQESSWFDQKWPSQQKGWLGSNWPGQKTADQEKDWLSSNWPGQKTADPWQENQPAQREDKKEDTAAVPRQEIQIKQQVNNNNKGENEVFSTANYRFQRSSDQPKQCILM